MNVLNSCVINIFNIFFSIFTCILNTDDFGLKCFLNLFFIRQPEFGNWAFNLYRGKDLLDKWNQIPEGIDILMTHGPPIGKLLTHVLKLG